MVVELLVDGHYIGQLFKRISAVASRIAPQRYLTGTFALIGMIPGVIRVGGQVDQPLGNREKPAVFIINIDIHGINVTAAGNQRNQISVGLGLGLIDFGIGVRIDRNPFEQAEEFCIHGQFNVHVINFIEKRFQLCAVLIQEIPAVFRVFIGQDGHEDHGD